jgi:hypothetical protein
MAYDAFGEYIGGQRDPYEEERRRQEEEERKRREEEERMARLAAVAGGPGVAGGQGSGTYYDDQGRLIVADQTGNTNQPIAPGDDPLGAFINQKMQGVRDRFGQVQQAFEDPAQAFRDRMDAATGQTPAPVKPDEVIKKEQVETRADGSKVVKTTSEVPAAQSTVPGEEIVQPVVPGAPAAEAGGGRGFVNPAPVVQTAPSATPAPTMPQDYNKRIAQMESGGRDDIGYHDRSKSSAYGKYGITDKAWADAQRANPALAGVRKEQANPEQMEMAQNTVTNNNARYLNKLGVEVNPNTLAAAHFIGAQGLANYLRDGTISESAIRANGGYDKTKRIIDQRLGGVAAPASGAAQQQAQRPQAVAPVAPPVEAPQAAPAEPAPVSPYSLSTGQPSIGLKVPSAQPAPTASPASQAINTYQAVQDDPMALLKLRNDETVPAFIRERAGNQAYELLNRERKTAAAETQVEKMVASGDQSAIAKTLASKPKTEEGSFLKAVLYARLGLNDLAAEEQMKLGAGAKWTTVTGPNGENALVKVAANGRPLEGVKADGSALSDNELVQFGGNAGVKFTKPDVSTQDVEATIDGKTVKGRVVTTYDRNNNPTTMVESGGKKYAYNGTWKPTSIGTAAEKAETAAGIKLRYAGPTAYTEAGAKIAAETNVKYGVNIGYATQTPGAPLVDLNTGKPVQVSAGGVITTTQTGTPGAGAPAGVTTTAPAAAGGLTPAQLETGTAVGKVAQEQFVKTTVPAVLEQGNNGRDIATARRQQIGIIENNPSILDIYNGSGTQYDQARNVISKLLTGVYNENNSGDFYKDVKATGLSTNERAAIEQMWNLTQGINGKTLKTNTGGGPVSNADMRTNQAANLQNFTETTPLGALQVINRSKFQGDLDTAKAAFIAKNPGLTDDVKFADAWSKESARYTKAYEGIAEARAQFLKPFAPPKDATREQLSVFRDKVFKSFEMYPVPAYDAEAGKWTYGTANAERAAAKKLLGR